MSRIPEIEVSEAKRSQLEKDLAKHITEKVQRAVMDAWELVEDDAARARLAVSAASVGIGMAAAALHDACEQRPGIVPSERDFYFQVLKLIGNHVVMPLKDVRRG